ncbi:MAG: hypothetical protein U0T77_05985 [Chitinophagales bacterium]
MELTSDPNQKEETISSTNYQPAPLSTSTAQVTPTQPIPAPADKNNSTVVNTSGASTTDNKEVDELQKQVEELKRQLEAKKQADATEAQKKQEQEKFQQQQEAEKLKQQLAVIEKQKQEEALRQKQEQEKLQKQKEIEELKRQIAEKEKEVSTSTVNTTPNTSISTTKNTTDSYKPTNNTKTIEQSEMTTLRDSYEIVQFTVNLSNNIPMPEYPLRPYYLDGNSLKQLERSESSVDIKVKGAGYGGHDRFLTAFDPESRIQFKEGNLPRLFLSTESKTIDPYDVISLCKAITQKDRRRFKIGSSKLFGGARDVRDNIISLEFKKIHDTLYEIIIPEKLEVGEYGFLPILEGDSNYMTSKSVKINCFGIAP